MRPDMGMKPPHKIAATEINPQYDGYLDAVGAFMVKGWTRSFCAMTLMLCAWQCDEFREAWSKASDVAEAYAIGKLESAAAINLFKEEQLQRRCGAFQACLEAFRFLLRHADPELQNMLEQTVPPVDLSLIAIFRSPIAKYQKQARLAEKMASATFQQVQAKLDTDLETMSAYGAMDIRYLQNRYEKGKLWVQEYMNKNQIYIPATLSNAQAEILTHQRATLDVGVPAM
eukprot:s59_g92.t1